MWHILVRFNRLKKIIMCYKKNIKKFYDALLTNQISEAKTIPKSCYMEKWSGKKINGSPVNTGIVFLT